MTVLRARFWSADFASVVDFRPGVEEDIRQNFPTMRRETSEDIEKQIHDNIKS